MHKRKMNSKMSIEPFANAYPKLPGVPVPENFFAQYLGTGAWWTVPLAVILAVPMYANAAGIVPVIQVFVVKGVPIGTAIAFMMATVGLSIPEATLLKKVMTLKLIGIFFGLIALFIIISGYLFNLLL
jgi:uncharacterized membrane protein YraQ (UPF0718 family)